MTPMLWGRVLTLCALTLTAAAGTARAQAGGRIAGTVLDVDGRPVEGVTVTVTSPDRTDFELVKTTTGKGKFVLAFSDAAAAYVCRLEKDGYKTVVMPVNPVAGQTLMREFVLPPLTAEEQAAASQEAALSGAGRAVAVYNEGVEAQRAGDLEQAARRFQEAAELNPELAAAHTALAAVAHIRGEYERAAAEAEKALVIDPSDTRAMQIRYDAYEKMGDEVRAAEAAEALKASGAASDSAARVFNDGVKAYREGDLATAKARFEAAAGLDPSLVRARLVLAQIHLSEGNPAEAAIQATETLAVEPDNIDALKIKYDASRQLGDTTAVGEALTAIAELDSEWATTGLYEHAVELYNAGRIEDAVQALEQVLEVEPDHARANYLLGMALYNTGAAERARQHLGRFLELAPDDPDAAIAREMLAYVN